MIETGSQRLDPVFHKSMFQRVNTFNSHISTMEAASDAKQNTMDRSQAELQPDINNAIFFAREVPPFLTSGQKIMAASAS